MSCALERWHAICEERNPAALDTLIAENAVFFSPVVYTPQAGKAKVIRYLKAAAEILFHDRFRYVRELRGTDEATLEFTVTIHNTGDDDDIFDLESRGDESSWVTFHDNGISVGAGGQVTTSGTISIPSDADDGNAYVEIWATSRGDQDAQDDKVIKVVVEELEAGATLRRDRGWLLLPILLLRL